MVNSGEYIKGYLKIAVVALPSANLNTVNHTLAQGRSTGQITKVVHAKTRGGWINSGVSSFLQVYLPKYALRWVVSLDKEIMIWTKIAHQMHRAKRAKKPHTPQNNPLTLEPP